MGTCRTQIVPVYQEDLCGGERINTKCIFDENAFIELGLPINSTQGQINQKLYQVVLAQKLLIDSLVTTKLSNPVLEFTDNTNALANGLLIGDSYRTGDLVKVVH